MEQVPILLSLVTMFVLAELLSCCYSFSSVRQVMKLKETKKKLLVFAI